MSVGKRNVGLVDKKLVVIRGGGDLATGTICRLHMAGFKVIVLEIDKPTVIRRTVAMAQCVFTGETEVEGITARWFEGVEEALAQVERGIVAVLVDPLGETLKYINSFVLIDAILAKKNLGTQRGWAPIVIGLGPGFTAGEDVDAVVETKRGHDLGRVYYQGSALPNTGIPGDIINYGEERVVRSPILGFFNAECQIGDLVEKGQKLGTIIAPKSSEKAEVKAPLSGVLRGLIHEGIGVEKGMKIGDVDPRGQRESCWTISDKARAVAGGVLEAILYLERELEVK